MKRTYTVPRIAAWALNVLLFIIYVYVSMFPLSLIVGIMTLLTNNTSIAFIGLGIDILFLIALSIICTKHMYITSQE